MQRKKTVEDFTINLESAEAEYKKDPVAFNAKQMVSLDKMYRPTLYRLEHGQEENILRIGDWAVDPDGDILDIVHVCDGDKFFSPTVELRERGKEPSVYKTPRYYKEGRCRLVCVTCGGSPGKDVNVVIDLMLKRQEYLGEGKDTLDDPF